MANISMEMSWRRLLEKCSLKKYFSMIKMLLFPLIESWASCSSGLHAKSVVDELRGATVDAEETSDIRDARPERIDQQHLKVGKMQLFEAARECQPIRDEYSGAVVKTTGRTHGCNVRKQPRSVHWKTS